MNHVKVFASRLGPFLFQSPGKWMVHKQNEEKWRKETFQRTSLVSWSSADWPIQCESPLKCKVEAKTFGSVLYVTSNRFVCLWWESVWLRRVWIKPRHVGTVFIAVRSALQTLYCIVLRAKTLSIKWAWNAMILFQSYHYHVILLLLWFASETYYSSGVYSCLFLEIDRDKSKFQKVTHFQRSF